LSDYDLGDNTNLFYFKTEEKRKRELLVNERGNVVAWCRGGVVSWWRGDVRT
jgi:hypothetical protein